ncbi:MAG: hypothetical protein Q7J15_07380 [Candidatus Desulfaltia sp.]|nr:hypothetical protein [Candidatus Desulfaltia sp.]
MHTVDYSKIDYRGLKDEGAFIFQMLYFPYILKGKKQANIEILCFGKNNYGWQARILNDKSKKGSISNGTTYVIIEDALNDAIKGVVDELVEDPDLREMIFTQEKVRQESN